MGGKLVEHVLRGHIRKKLGRVLEHESQLCDQGRAAWMPYRRCRSGHRRRSCRARCWLGFGPAIYRITVKQFAPHLHAHAEVEPEAAELTLEPGSASGIRGRR